MREHHTGAVRNLDLTPTEETIIDFLTQRPMCIDELAVKTDVLSAHSLPLARLEENFMIQRCGLTLTDLLHITGGFIRWDTDLAREYAGFLAFLSYRDMDYG